MRDTIKKIYFILGRQNIFKLLIVLLLTLLNTIFELISISLIIPILGIFIGQDYEKYFNIFPIFAGMSASSLIVSIFAIFLSIYILKFGTSIISLYFRNKFCWELFKDLSRKIFYNYIKQDYITHFKSHSSEKLNNIRGEASLFSFGVTLQTIDLVIDTILIISISLFLLFYSFQFSLIVIIFFIIFSFSWNSYYNQYLKKIGKKREIHAKETIKEIQNAFGNFRETIIFGLEDLFLKRFEAHNIKFSKIGIKRDTIIQIPRYLFELLSVFGIFLIFFILTKNKMPLSEILILLGVFVFATIRMLPAVTKIIRSIQTIKFNNIVIDQIHNHLINFSNLNLDYENSERLNFNKLSIKNLNYRYPKQEKYILNNINLDIEKGDKIGIFGDTGCGKSTLINIITGLLKVSKENFIINDFNLNEEKIRSWTSNIGYVSHDVFLLNETLGYNISLKENYKSEEKKIFDILKKVELFEYVEQQSLKLDTLVGEKGSNLSRGQTQRLGIARALYINPSILIFDEATSALDTSTERKILEKLFSENQNHTIISVSHRKSAFEFCDQIFEIKHGQIKKIVNK